MKTHVVKFVEKIAACPGDRKHAKRLHKDIEALCFLCDALGDKVVIDLDGGPGYAASFLEELFGGLVRKKGCGLGLLIDLEMLSFISNDEPHLIEEIRRFVNEAEMDRCNE